MNLDNLKIVVSAIGGVIYLSEMEDSNFMNDDVRKDVTDEVLRASIDWFINNSHTAVSFPYKDEDKRAHLYFTDDEDKSERILAILKEGREEEG